MDYDLPGLYHRPNPRLPINNVPRDGEHRPTYKEPGRLVPIFVESSQPIRIFEEFNVTQQRSRTSNSTTSMQRHIQEKQAHEKPNKMHANLEFCRISNANIGQANMHHILTSMVTINNSEHLYPIFIHGLAMAGVVRVSCVAWLLGAKARAR
ncbi:hypothetical protein GGR58DRAFT_490984 [Xylaria digitata]|nr:hypothetical protein GGR58DRAFT_490984 [Xylaria digitata]